MRVEGKLLNVDNIVLAEYFIERPQFYREDVRYPEGLQIHFLDGSYRRIVTEMTVDQFEQARNKFFEEENDEKD